MAVCLGPERLHPMIVTERTPGVDVGRIIIPTASRFRSWEASRTFLRYYNALNNPTRPNEAAALRRRLVFHLNNNTADERGALPHERPVSAYFTLDPIKEVVIIEWGTIDPLGEAKLHTFLNQALNPSERVNQGMKLSSGHLTRAIGNGETTYLALIDNLSPVSQEPNITAKSPMGYLINALHFASMIPLAGDGSVRLPAF